MIPVIMEYLDPLLKASSVYCEPFVGGASVALEVAFRYPDIQLFLNDKDSWVSSFWQVIALKDDMALRELLTLLEVEPTLERFYKLACEPPEGLIRRAQYAIFFNRCCFSGIVKRNQIIDRKTGLAKEVVTSSPIGGKNQLSKYKVNCRYNFKKLKEKMLYCHKLLAGRTQVSNVDFSTYSPLTHENYVTYADPPYIKAASQLYNEYMSLPEHANLRNILVNKSNWLLSLDNCQEARYLYQNCKIQSLDVRYSIRAHNENWTQDKELIILSK